MGSKRRIVARERELAEVYPRRLHPYPYPIGRRLHSSQRQDERVKKFVYLDPSDSYRPDLILHEEF